MEKEQRRIVGQLCVMHPRSLSHLPAISHALGLACKINTRASATARYENLLRKTIRRHGGRATPRRLGTRR
jgi:hypothetical protein